MSNISKIQETGNSLIEQVKHAYRKNPVQTVAIGAGIVILAPTIFPLFKPVAKAAMEQAKKASLAAGLMAAPTMHQDHQDN